MSEHLRPEQFVEALDGVLSPRASDHLAACAACQAELINLREVLADAQQVEPPTPSPLFWDHFSARVHAATAAESVPLSWWLQSWLRPAAAIAAAAGAVALALVLRPDAVPAPGPAPADGMSAASTQPVVDFAALSEDPSWSLVVALASEVDRGDLKEVARPVEGTADAMIEELTPAQRDALARLLREMGDQ